MRTLTLQVDADRVAVPCPAGKRIRIRSARATHGGGSCQLSINNGQLQFVVAQSPLSDGSSTGFSFFAGATETFGTLGNIDPVTGLAEFNWPTELNIGLPDMSFPFDVNVQASSGATSLVVVYDECDA